MDIILMINWGFLVPYLFMAIMWLLLLMKMMGRVSTQVVFVSMSILVIIGEILVMILMERVIVVNWWFMYPYL